MRRSCIISLVVVSVLLGGCESMGTRGQGTLIGAGAGAGLGALIGAASGSWAWGAVIGAAGGALAGYVIADSIADDEERNQGGGGGDAYSADDRTRAREFFNQAMRADNDVDAEYYLNQSIAAWPTPEAYNNLGLLHLDAGRQDLARQDWQNALALDPNYRPASDNLARLGS